MNGYLSMGSNEGNRVKNLQRALAFLNNDPGIRILKVSSFYETEPWGGVEQSPFINIVVKIDSTLKADELLKSCQTVENQLGRKRLVHWGPRIIDVDILMLGDIRITDEKLTIPHPYMEEREFVLAPLREIAPDLILPSGKWVKDIKGQGEVKKISFYSN